ncbi:MAG TPA: phage tail sheath subtilisin-like domain-containing protein [Pyrinomonadaceae bacterium]|nr:phage tail sheath subtilisin-like domain-containing protein [Pyrinomonadaceae bacterium]
MPEYLAPGVYVEETSFRAKSIEGVSTSTTGFAGPTRKGPIGGISDLAELTGATPDDDNRIFEAPELITNLGDFERIYGGLDDLEYGTNYLAHAVRNYFNEGGARLYVSRVYAPGAGGLGTARSNFLVSGATPDDQARFVARFPGAAGNGLIALRLVRTPVTRRIMENAPEGTMAQIGGDNPATPAQLVGNQPPFALMDGGVLQLRVNNVAGPVITFQGEPARAVADAIPVVDAGGDIVLDNTNNVLQVTIGTGQRQDIVLPVGTFSPADVVAEINSQIRGGFAELDAGRIAIGTDRRGTSARVAVEINQTLGFTSRQDEQGSTDPARNNVADLDAVTADEIGQLLTTTAGTGANAALIPSTGRLVIRTNQAGGGETLDVEAPGANSVNAALGLAPLAPGQPPASGGAGANLTYFVKGGSGWVDSSSGALDFGGAGPGQAPGGGASFLTLTTIAQDADGNVNVYEDMGLDSRHPRWIGRVMAETPTRRSDELENLFAFRVGANVTAYQLRSALFPAGDEVAVPLTDGSDGGEPAQVDYERALSALSKVEDISIVAAPGHSAYADFQGIQGALISHAERTKAYRIAVLDTPPEQSLSEARTVRSRIDSKYAALYYPWVTVSNPLARAGDESRPRELNLPPSGFVCGVYARNDVQRGVFKAPANEVVRSALRFETDVNFAQQEVLNPLGVNCLRFLTGRGYRVWGARTVSSDPEWKYVNIRRYFNYIERSVDQGTQWAIFEPNGERLWANIRQTISDFLYNEYVSGALLGSSPKEAYFVRCDRGTMTQNDLDNGRLICLVGVAVIKPAEFVIFRIGQKTADARS